MDLLLADGGPNGFRGLPHTPALDEKAGLKNPFGTCPFRRYKESGSRAKFSCLRSSLALQHDARCLSQVPSLGWN